MCVCVCCNAEMLFYLSNLVDTCRGDGAIAITPRLVLTFKTTNNRAEICERLKMEMELRECECECAREKLTFLDLMEFSVNFFKINISSLMCVEEFLGKKSSIS